MVKSFVSSIQVLREVCSLNLFIFLFKILHSTGLEFQHQVEEAKDLDQLIKIHYRYLSTIHDRCLLREKVCEMSSADLATEAETKLVKGGCLRFGILYLQSRIFYKE